MTSIHKILMVLLCIVSVYLSFIFVLFCTLFYGTLYTYSYNNYDVEITPHLLQNLYPIMLNLPQ